MPVISPPCNRSVIAGFSRAAGVYEDHASHHRIIAERLSRFLGDANPIRVLELGCGTGVFSTFLHRRFPSAYLRLTDGSPGMAAQCTCLLGELPGVEIDVLNFESMGLGRCYGLIASSCALQWASNQRRLAGRIAGALASGGYTVHAIPVRGMLLEFENSFAEEGLHWPSLPYLSSREWEGVLSGAGLSVTDSFTETVKVWYPSPADALRAVRGIGASLSGMHGAATHFPGDMRAALRRYSARYAHDSGRVPVSYRVLFIKAMK